MGRSTMLWLAFGGVLGALGFMAWWEATAEGGDGLRGTMPARPRRLGRTPRAMREVEWSRADDGYDLQVVEGRS